MKDKINIIKKILLLLVLVVLNIQAKITSKSIETNSNYVYDNSYYTQFQQEILQSLKFDGVLSELRLGALGGMFSHEKDVDGLTSYKDTWAGLVLGSDLFLPFTLRSYNWSTDFKSWYAIENFNYDLNSSLEWKRKINGAKDKRFLAAKVGGNISKGDGFSLNRKLLLEQQSIYADLNASMNKWEGQLSFRKNQTKAISYERSTDVLLKPADSQLYQFNNSLIAFAYLYAKLFTDKLNFGLVTKYQDSDYPFRNLDHEIDPLTTEVNTIDLGYFPYYSPLEAKSLSLLLVYKIDLSRFKKFPISYIKTKLMIPLVSEELYGWEDPYLIDETIVSVEQGYYKVKNSAPLDIELELSKQIREKFWITGIGKVHFKPYSDYEFFIDSSYKSFDFELKLSYWWI